MNKNFEKNDTGMTPAKSFRLLLNEWNKDDLETIKGAKALLLGGDNNVVGCCEVSLGEKIPLNQEITNIDPEPVFREAIRLNAKEIIVAQNAPFNHLDSNAYTDTILNNFKLAGKTHGIKIADYLIMSQYGYYSYKNNHANL